MGWNLKGFFLYCSFQCIKIRRKGELNIKRSKPARSLSVVFITNADSAGEHQSLRSCEDSHQLQHPNMKKLKP